MPLRFSQLGPTLLDYHTATVPAQSNLVYRSFIPQAMQAKLLLLLHTVGAFTLWTGAAAHLFTHPLSVRDSAISIAILCLGLSIILQELSILFPRWTWCRWRKRSSYLGLALGFLLAAAVTFDTLTALPCYVDVGTSYSTTSAANDTATPEEATPPAVETSSGTKTPPAFGTASYLSNSLAPHCIKLEGVPGQAAGSVAWVNVAVNKISRLLVLATCAGTLAISIIYLVLAFLNRSGKVGLSPGMASTRRDNTLPSLQRMRSGPKSLNEPVEEGASTSSGYRIDMYADTPPSGPRSASLYQENVMADVKHARALQAENLPSDSTGLRACSIPLIRRIRKLNTSQATETTLDPTQGTTSTPEQVFHISRIESGSVSVRAASDVYPRPDPQPTAEPDSGVTLCLSPPNAQQRRERYGYDYGYDRAVDFASGCIMHHPIFTQKRKRNPPASSVVFPTLLPPDFSRSSTSSPTGLSPRKVGKSRSRVSSKAKDTDMQKQQKEQKDQSSAACLESSFTDPSIAFTDSLHPEHEYKGKETRPNRWCEERAGDDQGKPPSTYASQRAVVALSSIKEPSQPLACHIDEKPGNKPPTQRLTMGELAQPRLGTAGSGQSILSNLSTGSRYPSSRPDTGTSNKSTSTLRLMRRHHGLLAALDLHLGGPLSSLSQDASCGALSYDSQRSCSAGTFGDGTTSDSAFSAHRRHLPLSPRAPISPSSTSPAPAQQSSPQTGPA